MAVPEEKKIAHYRVLHQLGAGAMGVVWKAEDTRLKRMVALKTVSPSKSADKAFRARLLQEARAASQLDHPNVCSIYQIEELPNDEIVIVMAFYQGETLADRLGRGPVQFENALDIAHQILAGLDHAHQRRVIHRDVKPANIMLVGKSDVKIVDFGLAKEADSGDTLTETGGLVGTLSYMSPEQVLCKTLDHRADLWACGVILYQMLSGVLPFVSESTYGMFEAILHQSPRPVLEHAPHLPAGLEEVFERALNKQLQQRFQNASEFQDALHSLSSSHLLHATQKAVAPADLQASAVDRSLVVLPFIGTDPDEETKDFCDGLTDEIITDLSAVHSMRTICSASSMRLRDSPDSPQTIARELGVRYVLRGTVRMGPTPRAYKRMNPEEPAGRPVRVTVQLIDPRSDSLVWGDKYLGKVEDVFIIQENISRQIVAALKLRLSPEENRQMEARPLPDVRALQFYVKAKHEILNYSREALDRALEYLEMGEKTVGRNALLLATKGQVYWQFVNAGLSSDPEYLNRARDCAVEAAKLEPDSAYVLRLRGLICFQESKMQEAVSLLKRSIAIDPNDSDSLSWYSAVCAFSGKAHAAMPLARRILEIDPLTPVYRFVPGLLLLMAGEFSDALPPFDEAIRLDPGNPMLLFFRGQALALDGRSEEAIKQFDMLAHRCGDHYFCQLGRVFTAALHADAATAEQSMSPDFEKITACDPHYSWALAECYSLLGDPGHAIHWLKMAVDKGFQNYPMIRRWDPLMAEVRRHPAFPELLQHIRELWEKFEV